MIFFQYYSPFGHKLILKFTFKTIKDATTQIFRKEKEKMQQIHHSYTSDHLLDFQMCQIGRIQPIKHYIPTRKHLFELQTSIPENHH